MPPLRNHYRLTPNRKKLRNAMTVPEVVLWSRLKGRGLLGYKFRRQHSIGPYILDFYCHALYLAIEVDGSQHLEPAARRYDQARTEYLNSLRVMVVRYTNIEVMNNLADVIDDLSRVIRERRRSWPTPSRPRKRVGTPLPSREGNLRAAPLAPLPIREGWPTTRRPLDSRFSIQ